MNDLYPIKIQQGVAALLTQPAVCPPALRQTIEAYAAKLSGSDRATEAPPSALVPYIQKVVFHAYKITDTDIERLKAAGYSEDAIYEITLCAAVGASLARLERGLLVAQGG